MNWAEIYFDLNCSDQKKVIFTDKKKFNLDGVDGLSTNQHGLLKEPDLFFTMQEGGGCVMVCCSIGCRDNLNSIGIQYKLDSRYYCDVVEQGLIADTNARIGDIWT